MITVFELLFLLKTQQMIKLIYRSKDGKTITIKGVAFKVMNSCFDIGIEKCLIESIDVKRDEVLMSVSHEKLSIKESA